MATEKTLTLNGEEFYPTTSTQTVYDPDTKKSLQTILTGKQDTISDIATIRSGASLGATALQSVPSTYRTAAEQDKIHDSTKQNVISDLETIRSGAALGAKAVQTETDPTVPAWAKASAKPTYTASEVHALPDTTDIPTVPENVSAFTNDAGYLTEHQSLSAYRTAAEQDTIDSTKQDTITDLADIRSGAAAGATALQEVPDTYRKAAAQDEIDTALSENIAQLDGRVTTLETALTGVEASLTALEGVV